MSAVVVAAGAALIGAWLLIDSPSMRVGRLTQSPARYRRRLSGRNQVIATVLALVVVWLVLGDVLGLIVGIPAAGAVYFLWERVGKAPSRSPQLREELPDALDFMAACLEVGLPMGRAVDTVASVSPPDTAVILEEVAGQLALGRSGPLAWAALKEHEVWGAAAADIARSERSGTSLVPVLKMQADDARREVRDAATKRARTVGVRSVIPLMACFLPAFVLIGVVPIVGELLRDFFG